MGSNSFPIACCGLVRFFLIPKVTGYMNCRLSACVRKVQRGDNELDRRRNSNFPLLISSPEESGYLNPEPVAFTGQLRYFRQATQKPLSQFPLRVVRRRPDAIYILFWAVPAVQ